MVVWLIVVALFLLLFSFLWLNNSTQSSKYRDDSTCDSPNCARCSLLSAQNLRQNLMARLNDFCKQRPSSSAALNTKMMNLIDSTLLERRRATLISVYEESGYSFKDDVKLALLPQIWMFPGLEKQTFWTSKDCAQLQKVVSHLEEPDTLQTIKREFELINNSCSGWKTNKIPSGMWRVYHLYDQGRVKSENCELCPTTQQLFSNMESFMNGHIFGNALFSVMEPGTRIEPHTGSCNYRLRCHLALTTPSGYRIKVGRDTTSWEEGKVLIFDDSFVHEVWHETGEETMDDGHGAGAGAESRVVLIFDVWHPQITSNEQEAIKYTFAQYLAS